MRPISLDNTVSFITLPAMSTTSYLLEWNAPNTRVTRAANIRVTRGGNTRVTRGYNNATVYPILNVVELPGTVNPVEIE